MEECVTRRAGVCPTHKVPCTWLGSGCSRPVLPHIRACKGGVSAVEENAVAAWRTLWDTARELAAPSGPRLLHHRRCGWSRRVGSHRRAASQETNGISAHDGGRCNSRRDGAAGGVGDLLLAGVLGLG